LIPSRSQVLLVDAVVAEASSVAQNQERTTARSRKLPKHLLVANRTRTLAADRLPSYSMTEEVSPVSFKTFHASFKDILGQSPTIQLLAEDPNGTRMYHEACIYDEKTHSVFITSNQIPASSVPNSPDLPPELVAAGKTIKIWRIYDSQDENSDLKSIRIEDVTPVDLPMANGGVNYKSGILICAQGNLSYTGQEGIVFIPSLQPPYKCHTLVKDFHGRPFNSVNDVIVHPKDGSIWFTDPSYGYWQGIRSKQELPCQVYRFEPSTGSIRVVAADFMRPNGLCFSPDLETLYVTDTGCIFGTQEKGLDVTGPSHIYAFDIVPSKFDKGQPLLCNKRLFAYAHGFIPDGIKCDMEGNVYSGCRDGVEVWNSAGVLIGTVMVEGGVANFCFGLKGAMYMCNETRVWKAQLGKHVRGALLGI
jgi:gluconolactonase